MTPERLNDEPLPEGFRMTELGALPARWKVVKLGEVVNIFDKARVPLNEKQRMEIQGKYPYCGANGIVDFVNDYIFEGEYVLLAEDGGYWGRYEQSSYVMNGKFWVNNHAHVLQAKPNIADNFYLHIALNYLDILPFISGDSRGKLTQAIMKNLPIPLPPLAEQRAIAHALRTVQEARDAAAGVAAALRELKRSLMRHLFAYGPIPPETADRLPLQDTELGALPAHWKVVKLGEVITLDGKFVNPANFQDKRYIGLEHIDPGNVRISRWGDPSSVSSSKTYFIQNQILYGKLRPYLDKAVVADFEGICSTDILVFEVNRKVANPLYVAYLLHTKKFIEYADSTSTGVNHPRTSWTALKKWMFPLPPLEEQQEIARILQAVDAKIAAEESRRQALEALFQSLLHHLMTGKVRVPPTLEAPHASCE